MTTSMWGRVRGLRYGLIKGVNEGDGFARRYRDRRASVSAVVSFQYHVVKGYRPTHPRDQYPAHPDMCSPAQTGSQWEASGRDREAAGPSGRSILILKTLVASLACRLQFVVVSHWPVILLAHVPYPKPASSFPAAASR
jgi:hypothetical protein